jgi:hypothetical protein
LFLLLSKAQNKNNMKKGMILIPAFVLVAFVAISQERTPRVDTRQTAQQTRIAEGRATGELTRNETRTLRMEQRHLRRVERRAKADGDVSIVERRRLAHKQDRASRHIRRAKHNAADNN